MTETNLEMGQNELFLSIRTKTLNNFNEVEQHNVNFNYQYYRALTFKEYPEIMKDALLKCISSYLAKDKTSIIQMSISVDNTYEVMGMIPADLQYQACRGNTAMYGDISSDAAKVGAILSLYNSIYHVGKLEILKELNNLL